MRSDPFPSLPPPLLRVRDLRKSFRRGPQFVSVLASVTFDLEASVSLAVTGPSGSGKSTLLHLLGTLETPDGGVIEIDGQAPAALPEEALARFRNRALGFVFQDSHLLPQYSVIENVMLPAFAFGGLRPKEARRRAEEILDGVGLGPRLEHRPAELSGGERQRAAVARALFHRPRLLLCDEPTGSLDRPSAEGVEGLLFDLHRTNGGGLVIVTHSEALADRCDRRFALRDGRCAEA